MDNNKVIDSIYSFLDQDLTAEVPVLDEDALESLTTAEVRNIVQHAQDGVEKPPSNPANVAPINPDWVNASVNFGGQQRLDEDLDNLHTGWLRLEDELRERAAAVAKLLESLRARGMANKTLEEELQVANRARRSLEVSTEELESLRSELARSRAKIGELEAERTVQLAHYDEFGARTSRLSQLQAELLANKTRIQDLENYLAGRRVRWQVTQTTCEHQIRLLAALEKTASPKELQVPGEPPAGRLESLRDALNEARPTGEATAENIAGDGVHVEELQQQVASVLSDLMGARLNLADARAYAWSKEDSISERRERSSALADQISALDAVVKVAQETLVDRGRELTESDTSTAELSAALQTAKSELRELRDDCDRLAAELRSRDAESVRLNEQISELQAERDDRDDKIAFLQSTIVDLEAEIADKTRDLEQLGRERGRTGEPQSQALEGANKMDGPLTAAQRPADPGGQVTRVMVSVGEDRVVKYPLYKPTMIIGRSSDSDIQIRRHNVSRHHAQLCMENGDTYIEDMGSKNGVLVNGTPVSRQRLSNGDLVHLGEIQLKFIDLLSQEAAEGNA